MPMLTKRQILAAYNAGRLDEVAKECTRYGVITKDKEWHTEEGHYKGWSRVQQITHHGISWEIHKLNGDVTRVGHNYAPGIKAV